jgi:hypothetical protein
MNFYLSSSYEPEGVRIFPGPEFLLSTSEPQSSSFQRVRVTFRGLTAPFPTFYYLLKASYGITLDERNVEHCSSVDRVRHRHSFSQ